MDGQAQYGIATAASKLDCVQIDGLVVLKIIKHSRDEGNPNEMVSGQLLGMDITQNDTTTLEVGASAVRLGFHCTRARRGRAARRWERGCRRALQGCVVLIVHLALAGGDKYVCMVVARQVTSCFPMPHPGEEDQSGEGTAFWALPSSPPCPENLLDGSLQGVQCVGAHQRAMRWCASAHPLFICMYSRGRARETIDMRACRAPHPRIHPLTSTHAHTHACIPHSRAHARIAKHGVVCGCLMTRDVWGTDMDQYVMEMLRCMRECHVDNNTVGWYMSTYMNSWLDPDGPTVATQFQFQDSVPKSVCLVYDPVRTLSGSVHLKAYRLSDRFMAKYKEHAEKQAADKNQHGFTESDMKPKLDYTNKVLEEGITIDDIFEEVPIRIHNSALVMAMLYDWACEGTMGCKLHSDFDRLDLSSRHFLEKSVENMVDGMDALRQDQERAEFRKRSPYQPCGPWHMLAHVCVCGAWAHVCVRVTMAHVCVRVWRMAHVGACVCGACMLAHGAGCVQRV
jgi:hypothetical protein